MTPDQILLVQTSFQMMGADGTALASALCSRLAIRELTLRGLLTGPPAEQARLLARLLVLAVRGLSRSRALLRLRARYDTGHSLEREIPAIGVPLVESVEDLLGATLPRSVREAWVACHQALTASLAPSSGAPWCPAAR